MNNPDSLDYEVSPNLRLVVMATDGTGFGYATIHLNLTDINDNTPKFGQDHYTSAVWEENTRDTYVTQVSATDMDSGLNAHIDYYIVDGNTETAFAIEPSNTGIVRTNIMLDREIQSVYQLTIEAIDSGDPGKSSRAILRINVIDTNDNPPKFRNYMPRTVREGMCYAIYINLKWNSNEMPFCGYCIILFLCF